MRCRTIVDKSREEEVLIYIHEKSVLSEEIESLVMGYSTELIGYGEHTAVKISRAEIICVVVEDSKVFAITQNEKLRLKQRLYVLEELLGDDFLKINQSCIVNVRMLKRFDASFAGGLSVTLKNGFKDYVSRRQLKTVKERIGI